MFKFCYPSAATRWEEVTDKKKQRLDGQAKKLARKLVRAVHTEKLPASFFQRFFLTLMRAMMKKNTWNLRDRDYWEEHAWFSGKSLPL
jgi:hypothetical protein